MKSGEQQSFSRSTVRYGGPNPATATCSVATERLSQLGGAGSVARDTLPEETYRRASGNLFSLQRLPLFSN
jgi:hypothetical protein